MLSFRERTHGLKANFLMRESYRRKSRPIQAFKTNLPVNLLIRKLYYRKSCPVQAFNTNLPANNIRMPAYELSALKGNVDAQFNLGLIYFLGSKTVRKDYVKAAQYWLLAAKNENIYAQLMMSALYEIGLGVEINDIEAKKYFDIAFKTPMNRNFNINLLNKWFHFLRYRIIDRMDDFSPQSSFSDIQAKFNNHIEKVLFHVSDKFKNSDAQFALGDFYYSIKNYNLAITYFKLALSNNHPVTEYHIGRCYEALRDFEHALACYKKLAVQEHVKANKGLLRLSQIVNQALYEAVQYGDLKKAKRMLDLEFPVSLDKCIKQDRLLFIAIRFNDLEMAKLLLSKGMSPNVRDAIYPEPTALSSAVMYQNNFRMAKLLLSYGAKVEDYAIKNMVCLYKAWLSHHYDLAKLVALIPLIVASNENVNLNFEIVKIISQMMVQITCQIPQYNEITNFAKESVVHPRFTEDKYIPAKEIIRNIITRHSKQLEYDQQNSTFFQHGFTFFIPTTFFPQKSENIKLEDIIIHALYKGGKRTLQILKDLNYLNNEGNIHDLTPVEFMKAYECAKFKHESVNQTYSLFK